MKVLQVVNGVCTWLTEFASVAETVGKYPSDCLFVEAPDYVHEGWAYKEYDEDGNAVAGEDRFIPPTPDVGFFYDENSGTMRPQEEYADYLNAHKEAKQLENKLMLDKFLNAHPLVWQDGKTYGVTMEDQNEIQLNISQYQIQLAAGIPNPVLEWHAIHEACQPWTLENLSALVLAISGAIYPWFRKMQEYKAAIYACETKEDLDKIELVYKTDDELAAEEAEKDNTEGDSKEESTE